MADHADDFAAAFEGTGLALNDIFYCAESVLLPEYRGRGVGHRFFDLREAHGRALGVTVSAFCGVVRPVDHPLRPDDYRPLDAFWRKRGYAPLDGAMAWFSWKDIDQTEATRKPLQVWARSLRKDEE
jgi:GNAT superfamily N-acetyltransferase